MAETPTPLLPHEEPLPPRTDLWIAAGFLLLSATVLTLSVRMPTYGDQGGPIYTAPGLVPSFYGVVIGVLSLWLGLRALRGGALAPGAPLGSRRETGNSNARLALAAGLGVFFVVGLIGRMPFWLAASIFVALFIIAFEWRPGLPRAARIRAVATALAQGLVTGALVTLVFERLFLVRLP